MSPRATLLDIVIPTYNARELVLECLQSLEDPIVARRIVVDDVSDDGTIEAVRDRAPGVEIVELDEHRGLAHALNAGAARGNAPYVLFLNNDIFATPGAVRRLVEALESDPHAASAGGRLVDHETGATQDSYRPRDFPGLGALTVRLLGIERAWPSNPWTGGHLRRRLPDDAIVAIVQQPAGACILVRRDALERVGGWDERYWFWYEDVDLSRRLAARGHALFVGPAAFRHVGRHSTCRWSKAEQHRRLYHGTLVYGQSRLSRPSQIALSAVVIIVCLPRIAAFGMVDRDRAAIYVELARTAANLSRGERLRRFAPQRKPAPARSHVPGRR